MKVKFEKSSLKSSSGLHQAEISAFLPLKTTSDRVTESSRRGNSRFWFPGGDAPDQVNRLVDDKNWRSFPFFGPAFVWMVIL